MLLDVPPGNDYFLLFINSTHGVMHATSSKFTVLASSATPSVIPPSPATSVPTVTVSGAPNPTQPFATTFAALPNGAIALLTTIQANGLLLLLLGCGFGAFLTLGWWLTHGLFASFLLLAFLFVIVLYKHNFAITSIRTYSHHSSLLDILFFLGFGS